MVVHYKAVNIGCELNLKKRYLVITSFCLIDIAQPLDFKQFHTSAYLSILFLFYAHQRYKCQVGARGHAAAIPLTFCTPLSRNWEIEDLYLFGPLPHARQMQVRPYRKEIKIQIIASRGNLCTFSWCTASSVMKPADDYEMQYCKRVAKSISLTITVIVCVGVKLYSLSGCTNIQSLVFFVKF